MEGGERCIGHSSGNSYPYRSLLCQPDTKIIADWSLEKANLERTCRTICGLSFIKVYHCLLRKVLMWENCETRNVLKKGCNRSINPENVNLCSFLMPLKSMTLSWLNVYRERKENSKREHLTENWIRANPPHLGKQLHLCYTNNSWTNKWERDIFWLYWGQKALLFPRFLVEAKDDSVSLQHLKRKM